MTLPGLPGIIWTASLWLTLLYVVSLIRNGGGFVVSSAVVVSTGVCDRAGGASRWKFTGSMAGMNRISADGAGCGRGSRGQIQPRALRITGRTIAAKERRVLGMNLIGGLDMDSGRQRGEASRSRCRGRPAFNLYSSACPAGDERASSWPRRISADEEIRLRREWDLEDSGALSGSRGVGAGNAASMPAQPWELRALPPEEQISHLNRGLLQLSVTFGWCVTDAEAAELDGLNGQVLQAASYLTPTEQNWVGVAVQVAYHAHQGQQRKSGEPFIVHPVEVTKILAGLRMDAETLVAGLLHDTVEDTRLTFYDIEAHFGSTVRRIVEGETKLSKIPGRVSAFTASKFEMEGGSEKPGSSEAAKQADNLRHMLIAMSKDWRVMVVKLSDRLHNMRTLGAMPLHKQERIAHETMGVFVPLARRMGLWSIKTELEDRCFRTLHPDEYARVTDLMRLRSVATGQTVRVLEKERERLQEMLGRTRSFEGRVASFRVSVAEKPAYTVWRSIARNSGLFENVLDCVQFTVAFSLHPQPGPDGVVRSSFENSERERAACYRLLESLHGLLQPISPPRVEDFIAVPKPNNYRALHSTVLLRGHPVEVQILTEDMDRVAHFGLAASQMARSSGNAKNLPWLAELQTSAEAYALGCGDTYSASVRDSLKRAQERRFVFDPQGKILDLAGNATMCDAARELHDSKTCRVAATYVNGRLVPLNRPLKNGDVVAILTAPFSPPRPPAVDGSSSATVGRGAHVTVDAPFHVHTGVWPWSMGYFPVNQEGAPEKLTEIDEIPEMTKGERRLAREVELKHARLSMFAVLAWTAVEMERVSSLASFHPDVLVAMHESPLSYLAALSPLEVLRVVMVVGLLECGYLIFNSVQERFEDKAAQERRDRQPATPQVQAMVDRRTFHARERELHNGRLAMIAIACLSLQSIISGEDSLARLMGLF